jgi:hypothetical protein
MTQAAAAAAMARLEQRVNDMERNNERLQRELQERRAQAPPSRIGSNPSFFEDFKKGRQNPGQETSPRDRLLQKILGVNPLGHQVILLEFRRSVCNCIE